MLPPMYRCVWRGRRCTSQRIGVCGGGGGVPAFSVLFSIYLLPPAVEWRQPKAREAACTCWQDGRKGVEWRMRFYVTKVNNCTWSLSTHLRSAVATSSSSSFELNKPRLFTITVAASSDDTASARHCCTNEEEDKMCFKKYIARLANAPWELYEPYILYCRLLDFRFR